MNHQTLNFQASRIEQLLALHNVPARVTGGTVTPRWVRFQLLPAMGTRISKIKNLSEELAATLDASNCRVSRRGAALAIDVPRNHPQPVRLLPLHRRLASHPIPPIPPIAATLGLAEDGAPLLIRLPSPDVAHILVAGTTGSGKTVLLQAMILSLAMSNDPSHLSLVLIDPKGTAFSPFEELPHLARPVITHMTETVEALQSLAHLMERRAREAHPQPTILVVIDELVDLLITPGGKHIQHTLTRLTQRGREAGIHVVAATQKPTSAVIGTLVKANFPARLIGKVMSVEDARVATGWSGSGAERLLGQGDFLAIAQAQVIRFQVAHVTGPEIQDTVAALHAIPQCNTPPLPPLTPAHLQPISPVFPLPPPPLRIDDDRTLANRLIQSPLWPNRYDPNLTSYRWGWMSQVCRFLFHRELEGTWDRHTRHIIALAENISSTTTTQDPPGEGPRGGVVQLKG